MMQKAGPWPGSRELATLILNILSVIPWEGLNEACCLCIHLSLVPVSFGGFEIAVNPPFLESVNYPVDCLFGEENPNCVGSHPLLLKFISATFPTAPQPCSTQEGPGRKRRHRERGGPHPSGTTLCPLWAAEPEWQVCCQPFLLLPKLCLSPSSPNGNGETEFWVKERKGALLLCQAKGATAGSGLKDSAHLGKV